EGFSLWSKKIDYLEESIPLGFSWDNSPYITDKGNDHIHQGFTKLKKSLNFLRIKLIENESSISDRHGLLSFPEILCSLEQPVNIFVSELCESDAYFAETNLSGIWFTDVIDSDATMY
ncbi:type VI secretion protein IcmF/TssM N-terminal domain-containing protein, partial [Raoultella planticola]